MNYFYHFLDFNLKINSRFYNSLIFIISTIIIQGFCAQNIHIKGKLISANNGEGIGYASVNLLFSDGQTLQTNTDFDGFYSFSTIKQPDSLIIKSDNYQTKKLYIKNDIQAEYNFTLLEKKQNDISIEKSISEVVISKKKKIYSNPAFAILEKFVEKKPSNNPEKYESFSYESYSRIQISMSDFGKKLENKKIFKEMKQVVDAAKEVAGADGKFFLPIFVSESLSDVYYQKDPKKKSEFIKNTSVEGIGIDDSTFLSQLVSSTLINYNFYNNYIRVLNKDFLSPVNDNFKLLYDYVLINKNLEIDGKYYYSINFKPKREADLAFVGNMIITHGTYALFRIDAKLTEDVNLNFIKNLQIQQEMAHLSAEDNWFPGKSRIFVQTSKPTEESMALFVKYYSSNKNIIINPKIEDKIFEKPLVVSKDMSKVSGFWEKNRHDSLSLSEKKMYGMIKEIKKLPTVKSYIDIIDLLINGYYPIGKVGFGPILYTIGHNNHEGFRFRLGFRTNTKFSNKWILGGYTAFGFQDKKLKFGASVDYIFSREPWLQGGLAFSHDLGQVAFQYENFSTRANSIFESFTRNGKMQLRRPFWQDTYSAYLQTDFTKNFTQKITIKHFNFDPFFPFTFPQKNEIELLNFKSTEIISESIWRPGRNLLESKTNRQISIKDNVYNPVITFRYTRGIKDLFGSDFNYNKLAINVQQNLPMGALGRAEYSLTAGIIPNKIPYPLLENHLGNEFAFYNRNAYNMMRFFEFTSNKYASLQYTHNLEGLITNSLPLINKWNWRNHITFNYLIGKLDDYPTNDNLHQDHFINSLNGKAYMELGYGVSNIFRFLRVDFIHRLSHLENNQNYHHPSAPRFSVKFSVQIRL